jgi:transposase
MPTSVCWNRCSKPGNSSSFHPRPIEKSSASDKDLYKARHLIENFFARLKLIRAIATRYDKTARNFLAAIHLAAANIWLI